MSANSANIQLNRRSFLALSCGLLLDFAFGKDLSPKTHPQKRNLFVYYTRTLNTHILANYMQGLIGGDLLQIHTAQSYPKDYQQAVALASKQRIRGILPPLLPYSLDLTRYDNVIIAAPLWDMDLCVPIKSFLSALNLGDKRVYFIITNAGFGLGNSVKSVKKFVKAQNLAGILDYKFKDYEKVVPNLLALNQAKIAQNKAFDTLDKAKIAKFVAQI